MYTYAGEERRKFFKVRSSSIILKFSLKIMDTDENNFFYRWSVKSVGCFCSYEQNKIFSRLRRLYWLLTSTAVLWIFASKCVMSRWLWREIFNQSCRLVNCSVGIMKSLTHKQLEQSEISKIISVDRLKGKFHYYQTL